MKKRYKKITAIVWCILLVSGICLGFPTADARAAAEWPAAPAIEAPNAIVMEVNTGAVLYEKDADTARYPASTTKVLTTLLALENSDLDETVTFSADAVYKNEGDTSHIARDVGEQMTMEQCLYAIMLESANECAYAVAEHVGGGDYQKFIDMMNDRAAEIGCTNSHFANSNGLHDDTHVTTCRDLALISCEAIKNPTFRKIVGTVRYTIPPTNKHESETPLNNHHQMISTYKGAGYLYDACIGGKTGYTEEAKNTLVTYAEKDGMLLVCVIMNCKAGVHFSNTIKLFDYCFDNFQLVNVSENETRYKNGESGTEDALFAQGEAFARLDEGAQIVLPKTADFSDTDVEVSDKADDSDVLGALSYSYDGRPVGSANILAAGVTAKPFSFGKADGSVSDAQGMDIESMLEAQKNSNAAREKSMKKIMTIVIVAAAAVVAILIIHFLYNNIHRIWRRRAARDRRYKTIRNNRKWNKRRRRRRR